MSDQLTPGPWKVQPMGNSQRVLGGPTLRIVAVVPAGRIVDTQMIMAAPDLFEACEAAIRFLYDIEQEGHRDTALMLQLKAAVCKACGIESAERNHIHDIDQQHAHRSGASHQGDGSGKR